MRSSMFEYFAQMIAMFEKQRNTPIFGRTDLRKGVSEAKFDAEADFDVKKSVAHPKNVEISKSRKLKKKYKTFSEKLFSASKSQKLQIVRNAFSKSFVPIGAKFGR